MPKILAILDYDYDIIAIGGGAAGFFGAIQAKRLAPDLRVCILEKGKTVLGKVKISGGGRCNVTHACFDPKELVQFYPRGEKALRGPFTRFASGDTMDWFERRGVPLKIESDNRVFPISDNSQSIIDCLWDSTQALGIKVKTSTSVKRFFRENGGWVVELADGGKMTCRMIYCTAGSSALVWDILQKLGHSIVAPVPSLFTFNSKYVLFRELSGITLPNVHVALMDTPWSAQGPVLITHWGLSGPGILKLSAWGARFLADKDYKFSIRLNWLFPQEKDDIDAICMEMRAINGKKQLSSGNPFGLPNRFWDNFLAALALPATSKWADLKKEHLVTIIQGLTAMELDIHGKSTFKDEFVTAGGVDLDEVNFKTFESKICPGLFMAGEIIDIDAVTGGFNFQAAWTGGFIAGEAMSAF